MIHTRKSYQYQIVQKILTPDSNPSAWSEEELSNSLQQEVIIGYIFKNIKTKFDINTPVLNLYTIKEKYLENKNKIILLNDLRLAYLEWYTDSLTDPKSIKFKNPPIKCWMDTKDNWVKKLSNKIATKYNRPYEECLSSVNLTIMKCYSKGHVYMGNLNYIEKAANNDIRMEYRYERNRLTCDNPNTFSMDESAGGKDGEPSELTYHDILGKVDPYYEEQDFEVLKQDILNDLKDVFSDREIDQILNAPGYLTMTIYRKLLKWRKTHKPEDYQYE